jgi:hypothetical protein
VAVRVSAPTSVVPGAAFAIAVRIVNGGTAPAPVGLVPGDSLEVAWLDAKGKKVPVDVESACNIADLRTLAGPLVSVVLPPGGVVSSSVPWSAARRRFASDKPSGSKGSNDAMQALLAMSSCHDVAGAPLAPGDYTLEVRAPLYPIDLRQQLVGRANVHVGK